MMIDPAFAFAFERIESRKRDADAAFTPGATPENRDVERPGAAGLALDPLAVTPPNDAFFLELDDAGRRVYTRDGRFHVHDGALVDASGRPVCGARPGSDALAALRIDPVDVALDRVADVRIDGDGTLSYARDSIDPRSGARERLRVTVGRIALARFPAGSSLRPLDAAHSLAPDGVPPHVGFAKDGNFAELTPFRKSASNIDIDRSLEQLTQAYIAFDALTAVRTARDSTSKTSMDLVK